ncbi:MAG: hypothetical protein ACREOO_13755 [bacterium]
MPDIEYSQLIITCEACGNVKRYLVRSQEECDHIFREFRCENGCGRNLYSFITLGNLKREIPAPVAKPENQNDAKESSDQTGKEDE